MEARGRASFLELATDPRVVGRALLYALGVGSLLIAINHGDAILSGSISSGRLLKMGLTVLVPYAVSTLSSVCAMRDSPG
jgi:hypothetical protein